MESSHGRARESSSLTGTHDSAEDAAAPFSIDDRMNSSLTNCFTFVNHSASTRVKLIRPLHIALELIFSKLVEETDSRLINDKPELPKSLQLPLFWTAMSRASAIEHQDITLHLYRVDDRVHDSRTLPQRIAQAIWKELEEDNPTALTRSDICPQWANETEQLMTRAKAISTTYHSNFIATQHVLLALLEREELLRVLIHKRHLIKPEDIPNISFIVKTLRPLCVLEPSEPPLFPILSDWAIDMTKLVQDKKDRDEPIDPLVGRDHEMRRLLCILSRCKKNSAVLLGDPGVGKTAIAEGLALRLVEGNLKGREISAGVPEPVVARVFDLDLASILASTACKSAYEEIVKRMLDEIAQHEERGIRAIIFMDNLSQIAIGGYRSDGAGLDAATIMKPFLMRGKVRVVGCSTVEDFRLNIEKDGALARQFSPIYVCESSPAQTIEILRGIKDALQTYHKVSILDEALLGATKIAAQFFAHKRLPDSAIDLIDETCAYATLQRSAHSEGLWKLQRKKTVMEMNMRSLEREFDEESERKLIEARRKLQKVDRAIEDFRSARKTFRILERKLEETRQKIKAMEDRFEAGDFEDDDEKQKAIETVQNLSIEEEEILDRLQQTESGAINLEEAQDKPAPEPISSKMVARIASYYTFIPEAEVLESSDIVHVADRLSKVVIGQPEAVETVSNAVQCLWAGLKNPHKPIASFLFGGPSGSGKTLLVKELVDVALRQAGRLVRINASDYAEPHQIIRLIGTPSCTGFDHGGQLTECVKRKPFSIVHIKDIERGCEQFRTIMQTILDEGILRDGDGNVVDFTNCIVIISTSVGQSTLRPRMTEQGEREHFQNEIEKAFPPEFLTRLDQVVVFRRMGTATLRAIIHARLEELRKRLLAINLQLYVHDSALGHLEFQAAYHRIGTARRLERVIRVDILVPLAEKLLGNDVPANMTIMLTTKSTGGGPRKITFEFVENAQAQVPVREPTPDSSSLSSPATSYYSLETDDDSEDQSSIGSLSVDSEEEPAGHDTQFKSWHVGPPGLAPLPQRQF